jgi:hypothetical protein
MATHQAKKGRIGRPPGKRDVRRLTVALEPEVYDTFKRMSEAAGISLGRAVGDWCRDTLDGAQFVTQKMIEARRAPTLVMREMQAMTTGFLDEIRQAQAEVAARRRDSGSGTAGAPGMPRPVTRG